MLSWKFCSNCKEETRHLFYKDSAVFICSECGYDLEDNYVGQFDLDDEFDYDEDFEDDDYERDDDDSWRAHDNYYDTKYL